MIRDYSLYLVTGEDTIHDRNTLQIVKEALSAGVDIVQMREKARSREELLALGKEMLELCREHDATFIVNDDPYLAKEIDSDGVHLGQEDIEKYPLEKTRKILGGNRIIGLSTHSLEQFNEANNSPEVDYAAFGPVFPTKSKDYHIGPYDIDKVMRSARKPVIFIGGIKEENIDEVLGKGGRNIAVIREITEAADISNKVINLKNKIGHKGEYV